MAAPASTHSALLLGATGATGRHVLRELLASPHFSRVGEFGRRVTPAEKLEGVPGREKLEQRTVDFERLGESGMREGRWDVVYITLGTSRANAGSAEAFERIDRTYVVDAAKEARSADPAHAQRLVYLSSTGASATSRALYPRSKGLTEQGLAALGYADTLVFRPGLLKGAERGEFRLAETVAGAITGVLSHVTSAVEIHVPLLAKAIVAAGRLGSDGLPPSVGATREGGFTVINNKGALALGKEQE